MCSNSVMVKRLKRRREPTLPDKDKVDAALARLKTLANEKDFEMIRAGMEATYALRDHVASMSDSELTKWIAQMRRQLR